jgi:flagellum-specific peptidoglycan hydrolase FlgJ
MEQIKLYLQRNWFKLGIVLILIFVAFKKDLSFRMHLNTPVPTQQHPPSKRPVQEVDAQSKTERFSESRVKSPAADLNKTESFDLTPSTGSRRPLRAIDRLSGVDVEKVQKYIDRFDRVAISERDKFGIPASITLANALLHSLAGSNEWSVEGNNNHFALPCTADWQGPKEQFGGKCVRLYENAWTSFRDHSLYLTTGANSSLTRLADDDISGWAKGLEQAAFSEEAGLADQLLEVIKAYGLQRLD